MQNISDNQRKASAAFLVIFGVVIIFLGVRSIVRTVKAPFDLPIFEEGPTAEEIFNRELAKKDTDSDGLSDYDELNLYRTSPYLEDSDSDGETDKEEIAKGGDPNCPGSENCGGAIISNSSGGSQTGSASIPSNTAPQDFSALKGVLPENPTAEEVRELLRGAGISEEDINKLSDEELVKLYKQTLNAISP